MSRLLPPAELARILGPVGTNADHDTELYTKIDQVSFVPGDGHLTLKIAITRNLTTQPRYFELESFILQELNQVETQAEEVQLFQTNSREQEMYVMSLLDAIDMPIYIDGRETRVKLSDNLIKLEIHATWEESELLTLRPVFFANAKKLQTGSFVLLSSNWLLNNDVIYKLSLHDAELLSAFPHLEEVSYRHEQLHPLLKAIEAQLITVTNPKKAPPFEISQPAVELDFTGSITENLVEVVGNVNFQYPKLQGKVLIPETAFEEGVFAKFREAGFNVNGDARTVVATDDAALTFLSNASKKDSILDAKWQIHGIKELLKQIKFAELKLRIQIDSEDTPDWLNCEIEVLQNGTSVPLNSVLKKIKAGRNWVRLDSGAYAPIPAGSAVKLGAIFSQIDPNYALARKVQKRLSKFAALGLALSSEPNIEIKKDEAFAASIDALLKSRYKSGEAPLNIKGFCGELRSYQYEGVEWLHFLSNLKFGGILADEMGLGKTVQTLAYLCDTKSKYKIPSLVIAPKSVMLNWFYEAERFAPQLKVLVYQGSERADLIKSFSEYDLIITSYTLVRIDLDRLKELKFNYLIIDEAQNIKSPTAQVTQAVKELSAEHRLALTGTPAENRPLEFWSIFDFLMPGYLGGQEFFKKNIERRLLDGSGGDEMAEILRARTRPFILRRTKAEVESSLPSKTESIVHVEMSERQMALYVDILRASRERVFSLIDQRGIGGATVSILAALLRLRQVCNHPHSIRALQVDGDYESGKFEALKELVSEKLESGGKIVVFSQFIEMLGLIRKWLDSENIRYNYLDGSTQNRQQLIDEFNRDESLRIFVMSLKAGGLGINLTSADTVIIYDPWWNPAVENQAADRVHRIGQTKPVNIYRLVTENSVEQHMLALKAKKAKMFDTLVNENGLSTIKLTREDIEKLLTVPQL